MNRRASRLLVIMLLAFLVTSFGFDVLAEPVGDATLTLQSHRYYKTWDLTRFVYRVASPADNIPEYWVLGTEGCITEDQVDIWSSTGFSWVDDPIEGVRFESAKRIVTIIDSSGADSLSADIYQAIVSFDYGGDNPVVGVRGFRIR